MEQYIVLCPDEVRCTYKGSCVHRAYPENRKIGLGNKTVGLCNVFRSYLFIRRIGCHSISVIVISVTVAKGNGIVLCYIVYELG